MKEATRDQWGVSAIEQTWQDLRFGVRSLGRNPGFTLVVVLSMALGIGANAAIFGVVNALTLGPLPVVQQLQDVVAPPA